MKKFYCFQLIFLSVHLLFGCWIDGFTTTVGASESIHVIVKDHEGNNIDKFRYDRSDWFANWHSQVYARSNQNEPYLATVADFAGHSSIEPHSYELVTPKILIEIIKDGTSITSAYLEDKDTFNVDQTGQYLIRCSTTIQVDGETVIENTGQPMSGTIVPPTYIEGTDEKGRYEFCRIELMEQAGCIAYKYYKRYTYCVVSSTITYVSPGEQDEAFVCLLRDPDALAQLADGDEEITKTVTPSDEISNLAVKRGIAEGIGWAFREGHVLSGASQSFVSAEVATLIYIGISPEDDLNTETLLLSGLRWGATYAICLKAGFAAGSPHAVLVGIAVHATLDAAWNLYLVGKMKNDYSHACIDDLITQRLRRSNGNYDLYLLNQGATLRNFKLATYFEGSAFPDEQFGNISVMGNNEVYRFENIPPEWFTLRGRGPLIGGIAYPMIAFEADLLAQYKQICLDGDYDDVVNGRFLSNATIDLGINWLRSHQYASGSWYNDPAVTSLAVLTMLNWDYSRNDPIVAKGMDYILSAIQPDGSVYSNINRSTYYTSIAILPLAAAKNPAYNDKLQRMRKWLIDLQWDENSFYGSVDTNHSYYGGWGYGNSSRPDLSNVQWALMGLKAADNRLSLNAGDTYSKCANYFLARCQNSDGGSAYTVGDVSILTMTSASVWSYALCGMPNSNQVSRGIQWLTDHYSLTNSDGWGWWSEYYYKLTLAKALTIAHRTKLGAHDWFEELSAKLADEQYDEGNWPDTGMMGSEISTCWAIMALQTRTLPPGGQYGMWATLESHCDLHLYDQQGRHLGVNYISGTIEENIPGATFKIVDPGDPADPNDDSEVPYDGSTPDEGLIQRIDLSHVSPGSYRLELIGTSEGPFHLSIAGTQNGEDVSPHSFQGSIGNGQRLATNITVTAMEGGLTLLYEPLEVLPVMNVVPSEMELLVTPGELLEFSFSVEEAGSEHDLLSVTPYCTDLIGNEMSINGSSAVFDIVDFDVPAGGSQTVNVSILIPADVNSIGTGQVIVESANGGTKAINLSLVLDNTPPVINIVAPSFAAAVHGDVVLGAMTEDMSDVTSLSFTVRQVSSTDPNGTPIGFEDLAAVYNDSTGKWECYFDSTQLLDGYYQIFAKAVDEYGNEGISAVVPFSICNWSCSLMLPSSSKIKAGSTVPVKFCLRQCAAADPTTPFICREDLEVCIYATANPGTILQSSCFGDASTDYRIDILGEKYITNFKTSKTPCAYTVEIRRKTNDFLIASLAFATAK